jgi:hypothetical protein
MVYLVGKKVGKVGKDKSILYILSYMPSDKYNRFKHGEDGIVSNTPMLRLQVNNSHYRTAHHSMRFTYYISAIRIIHYHTYANASEYAW